MANNTYFNKVIKNGTTLIDLTGDSVAPADVAQGKTFHDASGAPQTGTASGGGGGFDWSQVRGVQLVGKNGNAGTLPIDCDGIDSSSFDTMANMFYGIKATSIDVSDLDTSNVEYMTNTFQDMSNITSLDISNFDTSKVRDMQSMFSGCQYLESITFGQDWDATALTSMYSTFYNCRRLKDLDFGNSFDTSHVTNFQSTFSSCQSLNIPHVVSQLDVSACTTMYQMFSGCFNSISYPVGYSTSLDLSDWDTGAVTNINYMFSSCAKLTDIDFSGWDTSLVTTMSNMFKGCSSIVHLDLADFDTANVTNITSMFQNMQSLQSINFPKLDTTKLNSSWMWQYFVSSCPALTDIIWSQKNTVQNIPTTPSYLGITSSMKIYVPDALVNDYKAATNWSTIASQIYSINDLPAALKTRYGY